MQTAVNLGKNELQEGLEVIESTNLKYFTKEMTAEFYALKGECHGFHSIHDHDDSFSWLSGMLLSQIGRSDDAHKAFSAAVQMHDTLVKAWALWGDYLEAVFTKETATQPAASSSAGASASPSARNMAHGVEAITCYLHACRHQNESKSRKYLAKVRLNNQHVTTV